MKISRLTRVPQKDLIVFDLDGTLAETKSVMDAEMAGLLRRLLDIKTVAVIGGGKYALFKGQFLSKLGATPEQRKKLFLFPTTGTSFYRYQKGWKNVYTLPLTPAERKRIKVVFRQVIHELNYHPEKIYGPQLEDRGTQITFSFLGQEVVKMLGPKKGVALKEEWKRKNTPFKLEVARRVKQLLPGLEVRAAGHTSIDVTRKGIDKAYGLKQMVKYLHVKIPRMLFIGDAIFPGGNDYAVVKTGVDYFPIKGPEETKSVIRAILDRD